jgi:hypothetical protein
MNKNIYFIIPVVLFIALLIGAIIGSQSYWGPLVGQLTGGQQPKIQTPPALQITAAPTDKPLPTQVQKVIDEGTTGGGIDFQQISGTIQSIDSKNRTLTVDSKGEVLQITIKSSAGLLIRDAQTKSKQPATGDVFQHLQIGDQVWLADLTTDDQGVVSSGAVAIER